MVLSGKTDYYLGQFKNQGYNISACLNYIPDFNVNFIGFHIGTNEKYDDRKVTCKRCIAEMKKLGL